jgi:hypothetical protein
MSSSTADNTSQTARTSIREMTPEQTAEAIRNIAKRIREESAKMKDTVKIIRQSGAIEELTEAVREATLAARDSAKEINGVASDLKQRGVIRDTISAGEEITATAKETAQTVRETVRRDPQNTTASSTERTTPA